MLRQKTLQSPKLARRKRKQRLIIAACILAAAGILGYALSALSYLSSVRIQEITVNGTSVIPAADVIGRLEEWMSGTVGFVFARNNVALVRTGALETAVRTAFPRVKDVDIDRTGLTGLKVEVSEREAVALYCEDGEQEGDIICAYMDDMGVVFALAPDFSPEVFVQFEDRRVDEAGIDHAVTLAERIPFVPFHEKSFDELVMFTRSVGSIGLQPRILKVKDREEFDLIVSTADGMSGRVTWNALQSFTQTFANLELFVKDTLKGASFEYIDLRFGNNIFYKKYGEEK